MSFCIVSKQLSRAAYFLLLQIQKSKCFNLPRTARILQSVLVSSLFASVVWITFQSQLEILFLHSFSYPNTLGMKCRITFLLIFHTSNTSVWTLPTILCLNAQTLQILHIHRKVRKPAILRCRLVLKSIYNTATETTEQQSSQYSFPQASICQYF